MQHCSRNLKKKIRTCGKISRTGGVIAAASLAVVPRVYGEPVRWQFNDHVPNGTGQAYDIDNDGNLDVYFDTGAIMGVRMQTQRWENETLVATGAIILDTSDTYGLVKGHAFGESIDATLSFAYDAALNESSYGAFFEPMSPRYAGFYFIGSDAQWHNAWAELRVTEPSPGLYELDVIAAGYETEPYMPIFAGHPLEPVAVEESSWGRIKALYE